MENSVIAIQVANGTFVPILTTSNRVRRRLVVTTVRDGQTSVQVELFRGSGESMSDPAYVGSLTIQDIDPAPAGEPDITVLLGVDAEGNLNATATDDVSGAYQSLSIGLDRLGEDQQLTDADFDLSIDELTNEPLTDSSLDDELPDFPDSGDLDDLGELDDLSLDELSFEPLSAEPSDEATPVDTPPEATFGDDLSLDDDSFGELSFEDDSLAELSLEDDSLEELSLDDDLADDFSLDEFDDSADASANDSAEAPPVTSEVSTEASTEEDFSLGDDNDDGDLFGIDAGDDDDTMNAFSDDDFALDNSLADDAADGDDDTDELDGLTRDDSDVAEEIVDLGDEDFSFDEDAEVPDLGGDELSSEEFDDLDSTPVHDDAVPARLGLDDEPIAPRRSNAVIYAGYLILALAALAVLAYLVFRLLEGPPAPPLHGAFARGFTRAALFLAPFRRLFG